MSVFRRLRECLEAERPAALLTVVASEDPMVPVRARLLVEADGRRTGSLGPLDEAAAREAQRFLGLGRSGTTEVGGVRLYVEVVAPPPRLVVFGAGHDAIPLVRCARQANFKVAVVDSRPAFLTRERFPEAAELICAPPEEAAQAAAIRPDDFAVVMTHNLRHDAAILRSLLGRPPRYIGQLGPRVRTERMLKDLAEEGFRPPPEALERLHAPVGLDLGAETPEEIAIAIVAELLAQRSGRRAGFLRERQGPIH